MGGFAQFLLRSSFYATDCVVACLSAQTTGCIRRLNALAEVTGGQWFLLGLESIETDWLRESAWLSRPRYFFCFLVYLYGRFQMFLNSFFFSQRAALPVALVFVCGFGGIAVFSLLRLLVGVTWQTLLFSLSLLLFSLFFFSLPSFFNRNGTRCGLPHVIRLFLYFEVELWIITGCILRVDKSVSVIRKL